MKYLSWVLYPLVVGYSIYSLLYETHKSWYSWVLGSLVGTVYTFGFIMMCPQLYLNYKLKSVAHLPWRMLTYKALNTFIDDLFAFIITMPTLHRLSCFRDDIVFFIYLYQKWIYRVDYERANEFGLIEKEKAEKQKLLKAGGQTSQASPALTAGDGEDTTLNGQEGIPSQDKIKEEKGNKSQQEKQGKQEKQEKQKKPKETKETRKTREETRENTTERTERTERQTRERKTRKTRQRKTRQRKTRERKTRERKTRQRKTRERKRKFRERQIRESKTKKQN